MSKKPIKIELSDSNKKNIERLRNERMALQPQIDKIASNITILNSQIQAIAGAVINQSGHDPDIEFEFDENLDLVQKVAENGKEVKEPKETKTE